MAELVLGIGASHGPPAEVSPEKWDVFRKKDENDPRLDFQALLKKAPADIAERISPESWKKYYALAQEGIETLNRKLAEASPDAIVVIANDQREMFEFSNMPMFAIYAGEKFKSVPRDWGVPDLAREGDKPGQLLDWMIEYTRRRDFDSYFAVEQKLARHLIRSLVTGGFDITVCNAMPENAGMGHGVMFLYERLLQPQMKVPIVPVLLNTFYAPNQAPIARCYQLGQAVRAAIESFPEAKRVAVVCSGGLSHFVMDRELDEGMLDAMKRKDARALLALPEEKMVFGTSELRNWIAAAGALEKLDMTLVNYFQAPRSLAATGLAFGFAYWDKH